MNKLHFLFYFARKYNQSPDAKMLMSNPWKIEHFFIPIFVFITSTVLTSLAYILVIRFNKKEVWSWGKELVLMCIGLVVLIICVHYKHLDFAYTFSQHFFFALSSHYCNVYLSTCGFFIVFYFLLFYGPYYTQSLQCRMTEYHLLNIAIVDCILPAVRTILGFFIKELLC